MPFLRSKCRIQKEHKMAVFLLNTCKFNGCGMNFPTLQELIYHIEDTHLGRFWFDRMHHCWSDDGWAAELLWNFVLQNKSHRMRMKVNSNKRRVYRSATYFACSAVITKGRPDCNGWWRLPGLRTELILREKNRTVSLSFELDPIKEDVYENSKLMWLVKHRRKRNGRRKLWEWIGKKQHWLVVES